MPLFLLFNVDYLERNIPINCMSCWQKGKRLAFIDIVLFGGGNVSCPANMNINWIAWSSFFSWPATNHNHVLVETLSVTHVAISTKEIATRVTCVFSSFVFGSLYNEMSPDHYWYKECIYPQLPLNKGMPINTIMKVYIELWRKKITTIFVGLPIISQSIQGSPW